MSDEVEESAGQFIEFKCPYCRADNSFPKEEAGTVQECPYCGEVFLAAREPAAPGQPLPVPIATPRLVLRRLGPGDAADLAGFLGDEELIRYTQYLSMDEPAIADWIEEDRTKRAFSQGHPLRLAIELQENHKVIGWATVHYSCGALCPGRHTDTRAFLFVLISPQHQRNGFGLEVIQHLLKFCFQEINVRRVTASCDSRNLAAKALFAKAGMRQEGEFFQECFIKDECVDLSYFAMLAGEYQP
jgi:RimJ/RimL family protein N-acetyltransferase